MKLPIQNIGAATQRLRGYFGIRGAFAPELDSVTSPVAVVQDLSSVQGRGFRFGSHVVATAGLGAPESAHCVLFNAGTGVDALGNPRPRRDVWVEYVTVYVIEAAPTRRGALLSTIYANPGLTDTVEIPLDLRSREETSSADTQEATGVVVPGNGFGDLALNIGPGANSAAGPETWSGGLLCPPGTGLDVSVGTLAAGGDRLVCSFVWREFEIEENPISGIES